VSAESTIAFTAPGTHSLVRDGTPVIVLAGNPNAGKTSLFNALTGIRAKTANFPGTTVELRQGPLTGATRPIQLVDLPGQYSLHASTPDEQVACDLLLHEDAPDAIVAVVDATHLERHLLLASQLMELNAPVIVALTMMDVARKRGLDVDVDALRAELHCPVIPVSTRTGEGLEALRTELIRDVGEIPLPTTSPFCMSCRGCPVGERYRHSGALCARCVRAPAAPSPAVEHLDHWLTHPVFGIGAFAAVMVAVFALIFRVAEAPMGWMEGTFAALSALAHSLLPAGWVTDLIADGILAGVGGVLVFLPQIALLFLALSLLEETGYLARAALVMDRWMKRVGLPGKAFVPLLSAHACAIPAIMATRVMEQPRDRLVTILVAPLLSCSARLPVYIMIAGLLVPGRPGQAALLLTGAYLIGLLAALLAAWGFRKTILPGAHQPLLIELPDYRWPSLRNALLYTFDRVVIFLKQAGSLILLFSVIMWVLATFPAAPEPPPTATPTPAEQSATAPGIADTYAGKLGQWIEPVIAPLGFDWQIGIGLISSFAAREVLVSSLAILYGVEDPEAEEAGFLQKLRDARRANGTAVFTTATCLSLLVFYILAAQCIPTQIVTRRETGAWRWAFLQFGYMNVLAYVAALLTFQIASRLL
jgi:ferrous iron transport protein B